MPPIQPQSSRNSIEQEGRILLAVQAIKKQEISTICEAARRFSVPKSTLSTRLQGRQNCVNSRANSHKLTEIKEQSLHNWILSLDDCRVASQPSTVQEAANLLLAA